MGAHKFHGDIAKLDRPERQQVLPVDTLIASMGDVTEVTAVADLGCGTGYLSLPLAQHIAENGIVYAVDINPEMLSVLRERATHIDNIQVIQSEENSIPVPNGIIDVSFLVTVFHELEDPSKFLLELRRISKPVHRVIVVDWNQVQGEMGPPLEERIPEADAIRFFRNWGYGLTHKFTPSPYMYGLVFLVSTCRPLDRCWM
ncbi:MAG TPA: class I SAM-dependent methyltransferase [Anaerolineae bacterium]|nr:class I SAM-dependent methyltransferase [Anaerolineae bacterium]